MQNVDDGIIAVPLKNCPRFLSADNVYSLIIFRSKQGRFFNPPLKIMYTLTIELEEQGAGLGVMSNPTQKYAYKNSVFRINLKNRAGYDTIK